jgi:hypothetical protein
VLRIVAVSVRAEPDFGDAGVALKSCGCRKLNPAISVMQSAQDWAAKNVSGAIDGARDRRIQGERGDVGRSRMPIRSDSADKNLTISAVPVTNEIAGSLFPSRMLP